MSLKRDLSNYDLNTNPEKKLETEHESDSEDHDVSSDLEQDQTEPRVKSTLPQSDSILSFMEQINSIEADIETQKKEASEKNEAMRIVLERSRKLRYFFLSVFFCINICIYFKLNFMKSKPN